MTILDTARTAMHDLLALTEGLAKGQTPDVYSLLGVQGRLIDLYRQVGEERVEKFKGKERSYVQRKLASAREYRRGRIELKMTGADSSEAAVLAVGEDYMREIDAAGEWELYGVLLKSLERAIDYARSCVSFLKTSESHSTP